EIFDDPVKDFFEAARRMNLEGIVVKNAQSEYYPGARSREWLKLKAAKRQEAVIGGYTINENSGKRFSSLLVGVYENGALQYVGKVGTGFNQKTQAELMKIFKPLQT